MAVPEAALEDQVAELSLDTRDSLRIVRNLLMEQIASTKLMIERLRGVACYQNHIVRWQHHLEAFDRAISLVDNVIERIEHDQ
jgi:hypothetical protein